MAIMFLLLYHWFVHVSTTQEKDYQELEEEGGDADDGEHEEVGDQEGAASVLQRERKWDLALESNLVVLSIL